MSKTRLVTAVTLGLAGLLLTGCGSASPGVAARIGDQELTVRQVDSATENYCTALGELEAEVPMSFVRQFVIQLMALRSQAEQIADDYGVEPGSTYLNDVAQRQGTAATQPAEVREDYVDLASAQAYAQDILDQVGKIELDQDGVVDATAEQISQAGVDVFNQWPDANGVEIDPRYGLRSVDGVLTPVDTNTSVAVGETAKSGLATEPDTAFARSLPLNHRCG
ncbi:hypothetical protein SAMN05192575_101396 [Nocardioides alpinus]|uniref:SurA N-terminal domain-containing protein n=1 Tax=Nocardioides alpinus TaxID=748909 RepID=A0A1I0VRA4_9ACTN|nr:hypothetical protein [Nocardioides alpinus]PKH37421.1 hypothetical protein CXG46_18385 [Nocardioides alpinus]SFA78778.1 hypothetical protein SAMN05192575_101396 [Nocardioides alpinus]